MNQQQREDLEADLHVIQNELLPDCESRLDYLTSPDYNPAGNPDDEFRELDIEALTAEIDSHRRSIARIKSQLAQ